ncbi:MULTISPECIES: helix-turn-helix domain-containing protein [Pseudomonas]|jgi:DNA-binding CsgD family transcriptional regulator|nr:MULTISPECIES: helix-turn-helix domain-containing protein [Pseudomonas]KFE45148.1 LuxR family transcriptional regulator [Pseudomonas congelans]MBC8801737.1 helix-turn-helix domain-containing protein [Pseudomonas congelans]MBP1143871.1 LuxR family quorum-sensing transcriptional regulator LasR [Pseudomonas sp. PvP027]MCF5164765.1 helix-turn-helix transcriptional regulator [Pseudomonas congelans]PBP95548.1 helix-turn-helix transcriptional regulator [Pseudomonas congelans]
MHRDKEEPSGAMPPGPTAQTLVQLTVKERQILEWAAIGKTAWEIARIQKCSEATVHFHTSNIRRKFDVHSLSAALVIAIRQGVISVE